MSETPLNPEPQNTPPTPEQGLIMSGVSKLIASWRREWIGSPETADSSERSSSEVNKLTAEYSLKTGPDMRLKFPGELQDINDNHKGALRPVTSSERKTAKKIEKALVSNVRRAGVVHDLHTIYDIPDPSYEVPSIPDRRPGIGNPEVRAAVDEALRRAGLLTDQPPQRAVPKLHIGTPEYKQAIANQPLSGKRLKGIQNAASLENKFSNKADKNVNYVKKIAGNENEPSAVNNVAQEEKHEHQAAEITRNANDHLLNLDSTSIKETLEKRVIARLLGDERQENESAEAQLKRVQKQILSEAVTGRTIEEKRKITTSVEEIRPKTPVSPTKPGEVNKLSELVDVIEARKNEEPTEILNEERSRFKMTVETREERAARIARERRERKASGHIDPAQAKKDLERRQNPPNYHN